jgi:thiol-disulfide isomerase/thioredoxin
MKDRNESGSSFFSGGNKRLKQLISLYLSIFLICSCNPAVNKTDKSSDGKDTMQVSFKPNPQKVEKQEVKTLEIGQKAVDFNLPDVSGRYCQLSDFNTADILVVIFTCNHCPTAQAYEDRIIQFTNDYKDKGVAVVAIMPNSANSLLLEECGYSDLDDTYESMIIRAKDKKFNFPYLYDGDNEAVSIKYGPTATPHAFVFNKKRELVYTGRLDAMEKPGTANTEDLRAAVDATINGKPVSTPVNKAFGCSIKWAWKVEWTDKTNKDWDNKPVTLEKITKKGIAGLIANKSEKLRLINVWATWCGPCIIEYPELVNIHRMYANRSFEFVSISADKPGSADKVLEFLQSKHSAVQNYIFDSDDKYALIEAIDTKWNGALPYSMLVEPGGKIVYALQGTVDLLELKKKIIEHPLMGRYY